MHAAWSEEQERWRRTLARIASEAEEWERRAAGKRSQVLDNRKRFWEDVTVNVDDASSVLETAAAIRQQAIALTEQERLHRKAAERLRALDRLKAAPYFGRVDFAEQGAAVTESVYVGAAGLQDEDGIGFLVYDWRAPIASLYYDGEPGPSAYGTPGGLVEGELKLKRQYVVRDGRLVGMFDTDATIGDALLREALGRNADAHMRGIVSTIQKEQNAAIRDETSHLLVIRGAAGSGKTSAALQRIAYLLYRYRDRLRPEHMVLFSPNPVFTRYVSTVLPELGEDNTEQTTLHEFVAHRLAGPWTVGKPAEMLEATAACPLGPARDARIAAVRAKGSEAYRRLIDLALGALGREGMRFVPLVFRGETWFEAEQLGEMFRRTDAALPLPQRLGVLVEQLLADVARRANRERRKAWVEDAVELLDRDTYLEAYNALRARKRFTEESFDDFQQERDWLARKVVKEALRPLRRAVRRLKFVDWAGLYVSLPDMWRKLGVPAELADAAKAIADAAGLTEEALTRGVVPWEDAVPFLYLKEGVEGARAYPGVRHLVIDEGQDYGLFHYAFLRRAFPHAKMTVLGDESQDLTGFGCETASVFDELPLLFAGRPTAVIDLTRAYRSTEPIVRFTRSLIGRPDIVPFQRDGAPPTVAVCAGPADLHRHLAEQAARLRAADRETVALIARSASESRRAFEALRPLMPGLRLLEEETSSYGKGVWVVPLYLAKGIEFDAALVYDASDAAYGAAEDRTALYTACTRAMHELVVCCLGAPGRWLADVDRAAYRLVHVSDDRAVCPLCGRANDCAALRGEAAEACWCSRIRMPEAVSARIPAAMRGVACVCRACAESGAGESDSPSQLPAT